MRTLFLFSLVLFSLAPLSLQAGQLSSMEGKGKWMSSECKAPVAPSSVPKDSETPANDLNTAVAAHNTFVEEAKVYMDCISKEAEHDAATMSQLIIDEASKKLMKMQNDIKKSEDSLPKKPEGQ
ncbi:MAG TPA: hypothetical protein DD400_05795 [Rhodospirillaceae bacterium]|nr:hypothetical protein [Rhodospirillaceae bacterium]